MSGRPLQARDPTGRSPAAPRRPAPAGGDWLRTVGQELGGIPRLLRHMRATCELPGIEALDPALLRRLGARGVVWDVDGTLMRRGDRSVAPGPQGALASLLAVPGVRHVILSNCGEARFTELATIFPDIPLLRIYRSAVGQLVYRRRQGGEERFRGASGQWRPFPPVAELEGARALRKPAAPLLRFALAELGLENPAQAAVVGDQRLTDVAAASLAGCLSIKVPTLGRESFPVPVRLLQLAEEAAYRVLYRPLPAARLSRDSRAEAA